MGYFEYASDVRVGIVGYGGRWFMGRTHLKHMASVGFTPRAIAEIVEENRTVAAADWPDVSMCDSIDELLETDVNLVALITPHNTHANLARKCLHSGRHVILEKPFAITVDECDEMIRIAEENKLLLTTYHNRHWDGCVTRALETVSGGTIGDVVRIDIVAPGLGSPDKRWRFSKSISGGIMYDWGVHYLEYALQIVQDEAVEVSGFATYGALYPESPWGNDGVEDEASVVVRFSRGGRIAMTFTNINPTVGKPEFPVTIVGTKGNYLFGIESWQQVIRGIGDEPIVTKGENPPNRWERFYENIAAHLIDDEQLVINPQWARKPIEILDYASRSALDNRTIRIPE